MLRLAGAEKALQGTRSTFSTAPRWSVLAQLVEGVMAAIVIAALVAALTLGILDTPSKPHMHHNSVQYEED